jgi:UDP-N-acetylglucosamine--N-acetylmuramyl-(pentapeptide) pyrophosphoryl-undecaprenol N-acetylglucosamine transferase
MKILLVGGGSGGHFYPLIATAEALRATAPTADLYYIGPNKFDAEALTALGIKFVYCPAGKTRRYASFLNVLDFFKNIAGLFVAIIKLYVLYPDVVFSKGGFTSVPVVFAARLLLIPIVVHESDSVPGRASKLTAPLAERIAIAYPDVATHFPSDKTALVGIPIRTAIKQVTADPFTALNIPRDKPLIFITGGSLGAERLNAVMIGALQELLPHYRIFHQVGETHVANTTTLVKELLPDSPLLNDYYIVGSFPPATMALLFDAASLIITRAGSTTLFEIALHHKPAIVIPIPESVSHDQRTNAYAYSRSGAAVVIEEHNLTNHVITQEIDRILTDRDRYQGMVEATKAFAYEDAAEKIAGILVEIGKKHGS